MRRLIKGAQTRWPAYLCFAGLIAGYVVITGALCARRLLWNDELFTYYIAARPTLRDVWSFLLTGAEQLPPFFYVLTRIGLPIFGGGEFSLRFFELLGLAVAAVSVYLFAVRRTSSISAAAGAIFLLCTSAYQYAYEARPYGLVLAFSGLSIVAWQVATEKDKPRGLALAGLTLMLSAAFHTHYYAVLVLGPLLAGELTRSLIKRRIDVPIWISLAVPIVTLVPLTPLVVSATGYSAKFWATPTWLGALNTYRDLLSPVLPAVILIMVLVCLFGCVMSPVQSKRVYLPFHEFVAIACLALLPFAGIVLAKTITGAFTMRYVLSAVLGIAVLVAWGMDWAIGDRPQVSVLATLVFAVCFLATYVEKKRAIEGDVEQVRDVCRLLAGTDPQLPIVISAPHLFFKLSHYAPPNLTSRFAYLADTGIALRRTGTDTVERGLLALQQIAPLHVVNYHRYLKSGRPFLVYASPDPFSWVVPQLADDGRKMEASRVQGDAFLFLVTAGNNGAR